jgi:hypothetical protein
LRSPSISAESGSGAVDTFRTRPGSPSPAELAALLRAVDLLTVALASSRGPRADQVVTAATVAAPGAGTRWAAADQVQPRPRPGWDDFADALPFNRMRIHQGIGMVIGQHGGTPEQALARIRAYAFASDRTLTEVTDDIVDHRLILPI